MENIDQEDAMEKLNPSMFSIIGKWYNGKSFLEISRKSSIYEGSIIRSIKRLYELLK